jgi:uncharacterized protein (DUF1778 family)
MEESQSRAQEEIGSDFSLETAYQVARELLADEGPMSLTRTQLAHIFETLDDPPAQSVAAICNLLKDRSILDV